MIYTLSLHDALPICAVCRFAGDAQVLRRRYHHPVKFARTGRFRLKLDGRRLTVTDSSDGVTIRDRKSTRLNSSHGYISYAVFCLKKKKKKTRTHRV